MKYEIVSDFALVKKLKEKYNKAAIIWDEKVDSKIVSEIGSSFNDCICLSVEGNDSCKTIETYKMVLSHLVSFNLDRNDLIIGLGGGSTLDLAGFVASTYNRGVDLVYIPTTLLSMVDASIGGKNGINIDGIKNMTGTFYDPFLILINPIFFNTLDRKIFISGISEIIKIFALYDKEYFKLLKEKPLSENAKDKDYLLKIINRAIELKIDVIKKDPFDLRERKALNMGHTFGHAIESASKNLINHGDAVAVGMIMEAMLFKNAEVINELKECLKSNGLKINSSLDRKTIIKDIVYDKKRIKDFITLPKLISIGEFEFVDVNIKDFV